MITRMTDELRALLLEVVQTHCPEHSVAVERIGRLSPEERLALQQATADELVATGLGEGDEPNQRGTRLEALIDVLGRS